MTVDRNEQPSRRDVLRWMAGGVAGSAGIASLAACSSSEQRGAPAPGPGATTSTTAFRSAIAPHDRILVVIELVGGNDGLSTFVPYRSGRYHDLRPTLAVPDSDLHDLGGDLAVHRELAASWRRGMAVVLGVGCAKPSLSHFDMRSRWSTGTPDRTQTMQTGFLGRICDQIQDEHPLRGMSISEYASAALGARTPSTVSLPSGRPLAALQASSTRSNQLLRKAITNMSTAPAVSALESVGRFGLVQLDRVDQMVVELPSPSGYQRTGSAADPFLAQLEFASQLVRAEAGIRVLHIPVENADFDTHEGHAERQPVLMRTLGTGLEAFRADLEASGLADRVLIAVVTEFGRRVRQNGDGLDHGTATSMFLMGPVVDGFHGDDPSLRRLDADENLIATVSFDRYLATLAAWMDVDPHAVLPSKPAPLAGVLEA